MDLPGVRAGWPARAVVRRWSRATLALGAALSIVLCAPVAVAAPHVVQPGETLSEIAEFYGVPQEELVVVNALADADLIYAGELLEIPDGSATAGPAPPGVSTYIVEPGDTLDGIALAFGTSTGQLLAANPEIADPDLLFVGQALRVPRDDIGALLARYAERYGLDPTLVQALAWQESGWRQGAVSAAGAVGVMQVRPETADWLASDVVGRPLDVAGSSADNILAGVALLRWLLDLAGSEELALVYYHQGQGNVARDGVWPETWDYVASVLTLRQHFARYGVPPLP